MEVPETARPWATTEASLSDLTPFADWDPVLSTILSLRTYLFEHGAIPTWNYMLCGGRPELSVPFSWAYTWPSLFGYSLPPIHAVIAVWIVMTAVGFSSLRGLLRRWGADSLGASTGACLYAFSGCFAARFEAGHISVAFFHLVPLLMLLFEIGFARALAGQPMFGAALMTTLGSFLFMSAGLPHALMHFYPAFLLLVALRVAQTAGARGTTRSLRAAAVPITAHALGLWLAAYKLWPVIQWQLAYPRQRVMFEFYSETLKEALEKHAKKHSTTVDHVMEVCFYQARGEQAFIPHYEEPWTDGDPKEYPLLFVDHKSRLNREGRSANCPWYYEFKDLDPGDESWEDVAKINPVDGKKFDIGNGDRIRLTSPTGSIECTAKLWEGVRPGTVAKCYGQGHWAYGRLAAKVFGKAPRGGNNNDLIPAVYDRLSGSTVRHAGTRVKIEKI